MQQSPTCNIHSSYSFLSGNDVLVIKREQEVERERGRENKGRGPLKKSRVSIFFKRFRHC